MSGLIGKARPASIARVEPLVELDGAISPREQRVHLRRELCGSDVVAGVA